MSKERWRERREDRLAGFMLGVVLTVLGIALLALLLPGVQAEEVDPMSPRQWLLEEATRAAMEEISDTERHHCLVPMGIGICTPPDDLVPAWKRLHGLDVVKLPGWAQ